MGWIVNSEMEERGKMRLCHSSRYYHSVSGLWIATDFAAERTTVQIPFSAGGFLISEHDQARQTSTAMATGVLYQLW